MGVAALLVLLPLAAPATDVSVTTKDGKTVTGSVALSSLKLKTDFGMATIHMNKVVSIQFGEPDIVIVVGDVELRGTLKLTRLRIVTAKGNRSLKRADLKTLAVVVGGRPRGVPDWSGIWRTTYGPMKLKQTGLKVKGAYGVEYPFKIEGEVKRNKLVFKYRKPRARGTGTFEMFETGDDFRGTYQPDGGRKGQWAGWRATVARASIEAGKTTTGVAKCLVKYHVRAPKAYDPNKKWPAIVILHGSNMNSKAYVDTIAARWPKLAADYIVIGIDGESVGGNSSPDRPYGNYTYINFSGLDWGSPAVRKQSPALVAEVIEELAGFLPMDRVFVGGHSQGGFLTYAVFTYFPHLVDGAFPMSCNLLVQCEPDNFKDEKIRRQQRDIPIAVIHGRADTVVSYSGGEYCHNRMIDGEFPMVRLYAPKGVGHAFNALPVEEAVRWLETMTSRDPTRLIEYGESAFGQGAYRDAIAALVLARALDTKGSVAQRAKALAAKIDRRAEPEAKKLEKKIRISKKGSWVEDFHLFRTDFAFADSAQGVMRTYAELREKHREPANKLFYAARGERDQAAKRRQWKEIVNKYYASKWYLLVKGWLDE